MSDSDSPELTVVALTDALKGLVKWKQVALHLPKVNTRIIETIKEENCNDVADEKLALFTKWLKVHSKATWNDVINALQKADENALAESLKEKYGKEKTSESDHPSPKEHHTSLQSSSGLLRNAEFLGGSLVYHTEHSQSEQIPSTSNFNKSVADRDRQSTRKSLTSDLTDVEPLEYCDGEVAQNDGGVSSTAQFSTAGRNGSLLPDSQNPVVFGKENHTCVSDIQKGENSFIYSSPTHEAVHVPLKNVKPSQETSASAGGRNRHSLPNAGGSNVFSTDGNGVHTPPHGIFKHHSCPDSEELRALRQQLREEDRKEKQELKEELRKLRQENKEKIEKDRESLRKQEDKMMERERKLDEREQKLDEREHKLNVETDTLKQKKTEVSSSDLKNKEFKHKLDMREYELNEKEEFLNRKDSEQQKKFQKEDGIIFEKQQELNIKRKRYLSDMNQFKKRKAEVDKVEDEQTERQRKLEANQYHQKFAFAFLALVLLCIILYHYCVF